MQSLLFKDGCVFSTHAHVDLLLTDMRELVMAGDPLLDPANWEIELPTDPRHQLARRFDEFLNKALPVSGLYLCIP